MPRHLLQSRPASAKTSLALAREELDVSRRKVETGRVRVRKIPRARETQVRARLLHEKTAIERRPVNRPTEGPVKVRYEGDVLVIPVLEEVLVVRKQLMLKEEIRIRRRQVKLPHRESVTLRSEEAIVERVGPRPRGKPSS